MLIAVETEHLTIIVSNLEETDVFISSLCMGGKQLRATVYTSCKLNFNGFNSMMVMVIFLCCFEGTDSTVNFESISSNLPYLPQIVMTF